MKINLPNKIFWGAQYLLVFLTPLLFLTTKIVPIKQSILILIGSFFLLLLFVYHRCKRGQWTWKEMGIKNFFHGFVTHGLFIMGAFALFISLSFVVPVRDGITYTFFTHSLIGSVMQEFVYRSYLWKVGEELFTSSHLANWLNISSSKLNYWANVVAFTSMHSFFMDVWPILGITFISGMIFAWLWQKYQNFGLICLVHVFFNAFSVQVMIFN